jgi:hypothetical protein
MGSYTGKNIFLEPRSTYEYIYSGQDFSGEFSQPETFEEAGNNYPTKYNIFHELKSGNICDLE